MCNNNCGGNFLWIIIILLFFCNGGTNFLNGGCGCNNNCGCNNDYNRGCC